jgi:hypothetical protein
MVLNPNNSSKLMEPLRRNKVTEPLRNKDMELLRNKDTGNPHKDTGNHKDMVNNRILGDNSDLGR